MEIPVSLCGVKREVKKRIFGSVNKYIQGGGSLLDAIESRGFIDVAKIKGIALEDYPHYGEENLFHVYLCPQIIEEIVFGRDATRNIPNDREEILFNDLFDRSWSILGFLNQRSMIWVAQKSFEKNVLESIAMKWNEYKGINFFDANESIISLSQSNTLAFYLRRIGMTNEMIKNLSNDTDMTILLSRFCYPPELENG